MSKTTSAPTATRQARSRNPLLTLAQAAHPRQAVATAAVLGGAALLAGRPSREVLLVAGTVLAGQLILGWHNDLVDRRVDARHEARGKPLADGRLEPGTVWFVVACAWLALVPLAVANGLWAGGAYLASVVIGMVGNLRWLRRGLLSWLPWAASYALYPAFLSYGGWGGQDVGPPPEPLLMGLAALLGIGVHFLGALWGLVADNAEGWTYLPLKVGRKLGATRLLVATIVYLAAVTAGILYAADTVGLSR